ncbi:microfibril associated protein 5 isoform X2 [Latimeria chalumnae]|uniref:microfibril associated protein 5 isoform X2 n=1 Tax=Latimeria chalumnae TaxID=7897 RepID=UPI0003C147B2|nr:PREDICTED: microfibrillar-associated protein 5 isoform X2 [Latimeria chalumnae]|eukprot:XP_006006283.1 PREDICTED: microfibrillar-associated protein 5 isoform X2 [Latimeria chalumnae]
MAPKTLRFLLVLLSVFFILDTNAQQSPGDPYFDVSNVDINELTIDRPDCREEQYPCTRLYSVHHPMKQCIHSSLCFYSLRRLYVINNEVCIRIVCRDDENFMAELCREQSGWPSRFRRSNGPCQRQRKLRDSKKV